MRKPFFITIFVVIIVSALIGGVFFYFTGTPEYALREIMEDTRNGGMDGLYPHLTDEARATIDTMTNVTENSIFKTIINFLSQNDYADELKAEIHQIQWKIVEIMNGKENAAVILAFNYKEKITGTIHINLIRERREWKIDGLDYPKFDKVSW